MWALNMFYGDMFVTKHNGLKKLKIKTRSSYFMAQSRALSHIFCLSLFWSPFIMDSKQLNTSENLYSTGDRVIYLQHPFSHPDSSMHFISLAFNWLQKTSNFNVCQHAIYPIYVNLIKRHLEDPWLILLEKILQSKEIALGVSRGKHIIKHSKLSTFKTNIGR